jgi:Uma2 family endonuclease
MANLALVTWPEFLRLPERPEEGQRYELHDGEVVVAPPARPISIQLQKRIERLLEVLAGERGVVAVEFPYRPVPNLQYWIANVAFIPQADWDALPPNDYPIYAPLLIVEVLSPSNSPLKTNRQRILAMSAGTQAFWIVDSDTRTVQVTELGAVTEYSFGDLIPWLDGSVAVHDIFDV